MTALGAAAATLVAVVSGTLGPGTAHSLLSALALPPLVAIVIAAWVAHRRLLAPSLVALVLFGLAALVTAPGVHAALAALAFAATLVLCVQCFRGEPVASGPWRDYVTLTKPRIMSLLLLTGAGGMFVGAQGVPRWVALRGNDDRPRARLRRRERAQPRARRRHRSPDGQAHREDGRSPPAASRPHAALEFGLALSALSFVLLASTVNVLTATLALVGNLFYVLVYTRWLKRSTPQNIVIGGAAGAVPPLVGYAAATGSLGLPALWLFLIVFLWTPPHFWALALLIKENYAAAKVPMLPVVRGDTETTRQIVLYSLVLVACTLAVGYWLGPVYSVAAARPRRRLPRAGLEAPAASRRGATRGVLFHYSLALPRAALRGGGR